MDTAGERKIKMKTIKNKILLNYTIIVLLTVVSLELVIILFARNYYYNTIENYLRGKGEFYNEFYNYDMMPHVDFNSKARQIYKKIIESDEKARVQIINRQKKILIDSGGVTLNQTISSMDVDEAINTGETKFVDNIVVKGERIYSITIPLKENRITKGVLRFSVSMDKVESGVSQIIIICILIGVVVLLIVLACSLLLARSIVNPIRELKFAAQDMAGGDYKIRAKKMSDDEIGDLAETFNYMAGEIENSEKIKNDFISSISHELRTPLTSIQGWSETLEYADDEDRKLGLNIIESETKRLINLVEDLLDFSRYQKKSFSFDMKEVDIAKIIKDVANQYKIKTNEKNITLTTNVETDSQIIMGDKGRLTQVMINLLENAYKFTQMNGRIDIKAFLKDESFYIYVEDDGIGISEENLDKIFEKFYKVNTNKPGSGIGLALCSEIIKRHNGEIFVESKMGEGSKFIIRLNMS